MALEATNNANQMFVCRRQSTEPIVMIDITLAMHRTAL